MSSATLRFLQHENSRLQRENDTLREENTALRGYMNALEALHWATQEIVSEDDLFELLDKILYSAMDVVGAEDGSLLLLDEESSEFVFALVHGDIRQELRGYRLPSNEGIAGWIAGHHEPLIVNNPHQDWRFSQQIDVAFNFSTNTIVGVPMMTQGKLIGVIELLNKRNGEHFIDADVTLLLILAQVAAVALEEIRIQLEQEEKEAQTQPT